MELSLIPHLKSRLRSIDKSLEKQSKKIEEARSDSDLLNHKSRALQLISCRLEVEAVCICVGLEYEPLKEIKYVTDQEGNILA